MSHIPYHIEQLAPEGAGSIVQLSANVALEDGTRIVAGTLCTVERISKCDRESGPDQLLRLRTMRGEKLLVWLSSEAAMPVPEHRRELAQAPALPIIWVRDCPAPDQELWAGVVSGSLGAARVEFTRGLRIQPGWRCEVYVDHELVAVEQTAFADHATVELMAREHVLPLTETGGVSDPTAFGGDDDDA